MSERKPSENNKLVECKVCEEQHEWYLDSGIGAAIGQGWIDCPEYGHVAVGDPDGDDDE